MPGATRAEVFHATAAQWRLVRCLHQQAAAGPLAATLSAAQVSRSSYYRWLQQPGFAAWLSAAWLQGPHAQPMVTLLPLGTLTAGAAQPRWFRPAFGLFFSPYGLANLLPPHPAPPAPSRSARMPSPLTRLYRFRRYYSGKPAGAHLFRIARTTLFRRPSLRFQSLGREKEH
jgi:uncharacterized membrane protein YfcA